MKKMRIVRLSLLYGLMAVFLLPSFTYAKDESSTLSKISPKDNKGRKWRIGYYEGGSYGNYQRSLIALVKALMAMGWIEKSPLPDRKGPRTYPFWLWLSKRARSQYIDFIEDAYFNAGWNMDERGRIRKRVLKRLKKSKDIDLMIAMGTWAGQDLATHLHHTPTIVISSSDPLRSGIIKSAEFSGFDHLFAKVDPNRYKRQIRLFHDIVPFKRLGVAYENTQVGKSYAALDDIESVARKRKFRVIRCFTKSDIPNQKKAEDTVLSCFQALVKKVDAIYITQQGGVTEENISLLARMANTHDIPTFSQAGSDEVKKGVLLSISQEDYALSGQFHAEAIARIFNGTLPGKLNQIYEAPPKIAINLKTAEIIGVYLKTDILSAADEIYHHISGQH